ncbi:40S ribosomal protein S12 [Rhynchospora pubera]|uniref:40S ribosomal protein S12 n=1 Tax=Rhynchospora pubera TaxID=906938 RepID=A0AAV8H0V7_9POAL|nr:40S ribosomal protein S12 [Rhynchospora pubera]
MAEEAAVEAPTPILGEPMDLMTALQLVLKKAAAHDGLAKGLREGAKAIEKHTAQLCILAEDCDQPDYVKLVKALCAEHNVHLITVPASKTIGEWAGLCKIDAEGKARKVVGCSCLVIKVCSISVSLAYSEITVCLTFNNHIIALVFVRMYILYGILD